RGALGRRRRAGDAGADHAGRVDVAADSRAAGLRASRRGTHARRRVRRLKRPRGAQAPRAGEPRSRDFAAHALSGGGTTDPIRAHSAESRLSGLRLSDDNHADSRRGEGRTDTMARRNVQRWTSRPKTLVALAVVLLTAAFTGASWGATGYDASADPYSMYNVTAQTGVTTWWNAGYTGKGVDVALIDSGVAPVQGLDAPGKVVYGPDLSLESQSPTLRDYDTFGHGTFMAGLIAGRDSSLTAPYSSAPASAYRGVAPDARIISLKVATADGGADVSQVIAAIDWVVQH